MFRLVEMGVAIKKNIVKKIFHSVKSVKIRVPINGTLE